MLGAGVFSAFAPAAAAAGAGLLVGLAIAGIIAWCNAAASAQLAAQFPESGGTYVYGSRMIGPWTGFVAGWSFVVGKTASCAAMALTASAYLAPAGWFKPAAVVITLALTCVASLGVTRTATATKVIVATVLVVLAVVCAGAVSAPRAADAFGGGLPHGAYGLLQAAGLLFFAFAGYARIATMGEEVRDPQRNIPRAIMISLGIALGVYLLVAVAALVSLGPEALATAVAPLADVATAGGWAWAGAVVRIGAGVAALGALLSLIAGVTRTELAMARTGDLPTRLAMVHPRARVPRTAAVWTGVAVVVIVLVADVRAAIGFSSFGVLLYYLIANLSALRQHGEHRRYSRALQVSGAAGCVVLAATLPVWAMAASAATVAVGVAIRWIRLRRAAGRP